MAVIDIRSFGGLLPSIKARNLPEGSAQTAHNLDLRFGDFRPLRGPGESVATVLPMTKSLFRTPSGVWLSSVNDVNYVNSQINDADYERVYLTGRGSYPEAWSKDGGPDAGGTYRQLGVPAPTTAPTATLVAVDEFTVDERNAEIDAIVADITDLAKTSSSAATYGTAPTPSTPTSVAAVDQYYDDVLVSLPLSASFDDVGPKNLTIISPSSMSIAAVFDGPYGAPALKHYGKKTVATGPITLPPGLQLPATGWTIEMWVRLTSDVVNVQLKKASYADSIRRLELFTRAGDHMTMVHVSGSWNEDSGAIVLNPPIPYVTILTLYNFHSNLNHDN